MQTLGVLAGLLEYKKESDTDIDNNNYYRSDNFQRAEIQKVKSERIDDVRASFERTEKIKVRQYDELINSYPDGPVKDSESDSCQDIGQADNNQSIEAVESLKNSGNECEIKLEQDVTSQFNNSEEKNIPPEEWRKCVLLQLVERNEFEVVGWKGFVNDYRSLLIENLKLKEQFLSYQIKQPTSCVAINSDSKDGPEEFEWDSCLQNKSWVVEKSDSAVNANEDSLKESSSAKLIIRNIPSRDEKLSNFGIRDSINSVSEKESRNIQSRKSSLFGSSFGGPINSSIPLSRWARVPSSEFIGDENKIDEKSPCDRNRSVLFPCSALRLKNSKSSPVSLQSAIKLNSTSSFALACSAVQDTNLYVVSSHPHASCSSEAILKTSAIELKSGPVLTLDASPTGSAVCFVCTCKVVSQSRAVISSVDVAAGRVSASVPVHGPPPSQLVSISDHSFITIHDSSSLYFWDLRLRSALVWQERLNESSFRPTGPEKDNNKVSSSIFHPASSSLVIAHSDGTVGRFSVDSRMTSLKFAEAITFKNEPFRLFSLPFDSQKTHLALSFKDNTDTTKFSWFSPFSMSTLESSSSFYFPSEVLPTLCPALHPTLPSLAVTSSSRYLQLWDLNSAVQLSEIALSAPALNSLSSSYVKNTINKSADERTCSLQNEVFNKQISSNDLQNKPNRLTSKPLGSSFLSSQSVSVPPFRTKGSKQQEKKIQHETVILNVTEPLVSSQSNQWKPLYLHWADLGCKKDSNSYSLLTAHKNGYVQTWDLEQDPQTKIRI